MNEAITSNRREKRKASGKGTSLLIDLEDDFLDIEKNFKAETTTAGNSATELNEETLELKVGTNWVQSEDKLGTKRVQSGYELGTAKGDILDKVGTNWVRPKAKVGTQPSTALGTNWVQTEYKVGTVQSISTLTGHQRSLLIFLYNSCRQARDRSTESLTIEHIIESLKINYDGVKTSIKRLIQKGYITRTSFKNGRGGWSKYELTEITFRELLQYETEDKLGTKVGTNSVQSEYKVGTQLGTQPSTELPSSSSINITTTNYKADALAKIKLTEGLASIGFNQGHIEQLLRDSSLVPDEIQNSLNAFAFDLGFEDVKRKVRSPIGLIMKVLKNGQAYISEKGYESEEDRLYRELIERADKKNEEKKNLKARLIEVKFEEWLENISDNEKKIIAEPIGEFMGIIHRQELKEYFKREVYE